MKSAKPLLLRLIFYSLLGMLVGLPWLLTGLPWWLFAALGVMFAGACIKEVNAAVQTKRVRSDVESPLWGEPALNHFAGLLFYKFGGPTRWDIPKSEQLLRSSDQ